METHPASVVTKIMHNKSNCEVWCDGHKTVKLETNDNMWCWRG